MPHYTANRNFDIRMYFDGEPSPRINTNSIQWLGGSFNYFSSPLVDTCTGGQVSYEPIGFKHSVRIETENKALPNFPSWEANRHYYQYTYMTFPNGPGIESYTGVLSPSQQIARDKAVSLFNNNGLHPDGNSLTAIDINTPPSLIADGAVELSVIAQDTTGYGRDLDGNANLAVLLRRLDELYPMLADGLRGLVKAGADPDSVRRFAQRWRLPARWVDWVESAARAIDADLDFV